MIRVAMRRLAATVATTLVVMLAACTSVPLSTMWKLRDFSVASFFSKDPAQLRVAIQVDERTKRGPSSPSVALRLKGASTRPVCYAFALDPVDARSPSEAPLEPPAAHRRWYVFALSPAGTAAFRKAERELKVQREEDTEIALNVTMAGALVPPDTSSFSLRIDLALDRGDGYFTLIKETRIDPDRYKPDPSKPLPKPASDADSTCASAAA